VRVVAPLPCDEASCGLHLTRCPVCNRPGEASS
jgi:hypothetical protein